MIEKQALPQAMKIKLLIPFSVTLLLSFLLMGCTEQPAALPDRESKIPIDNVKITPATDVSPPILHSTEWKTPVPLPPVINTAGAEDSPFYDIETDTLYFFFTPDVEVPPELQVSDTVTGIYSSKKTGTEWGKAERVILQDSGKDTLDGCEFIDGNTMWFCSTRQGYTGIHWFTAEYKDGTWGNWQLSDFEAGYEVGELHIYGDELYFHSTSAGGKGQLDLWLSRKKSGVWQTPENLTTLNTVENEGWPYISQNGNELWFLRTYKGTPAIYRSKKVNGKWANPELILSQFAGEPTLDSKGNLYFVHHYYKDSKMLEADIYVAERK